MFGREKTMKLQNFEKKRNELVSAFKKKLAESPSLKGKQIKFSWSNWGFGIETLSNTAKR